MIENNDPNATVTTLDNDGNIISKTIEVGEVDDENGFDSMAAVDAAMNGEPSEFEDQIKVGLADRIQNAIDNKREEIAQAIFGPEDQEIEADDSDDEPEEEIDDDPEE